MSNLANTIKNSERQIRVRLGLLMAEKTPADQRYNSEAPLVFAYFSSFLAKHLPECEVVYRLTPEALLAEGVDIVGISASTEYFEQAKELAAAIKAADSSIPVLVGGVHITFMPQNLSSNMDIAVMNEGEYTLLELLQVYLASGNRFPSEALTSIKGIAYRVNDKLIVNESRPFITDLDELPFPDRDAVWIARPTDRAYLFTSRGCPYRCVFCASTRFWPKLRQFSAQYVADEIELIYTKYGIRNIHFFDDLFIVPRKRIERIIDILAQKGLLGKIAFSGAVRANLVDDNLCELLMKLGVREVVFGAESFSEKSLGYLKCNTVTPAHNQKAIDILSRYGIVTNLGMIYGSPEDTAEELSKTFFALEKNLSEGKLQKWGRGVLRPYPGTPIWYDGVRKGVASEDMNWDTDFAWDRFYMGPIPKEEFYDIWNAHERRCKLLRPSDLPLWQNWGEFGSEKQIIHSLFSTFFEMKKLESNEMPEADLENVPDDIISQIEGALSSDSPTRIGTVLPVLKELSDKHGDVIYYHRSLSLGNLLIGNTEEALSVLDAAVESNPEAAVLLRDKGIIHFLSGNLEEAEKAAERALKMYPEDMEANRLAARIAAQKKDWVSFIRRCERLLRHDPTDEETLLMLVDYYNTIHDPVAAYYVKQIPEGGYPIVPDSGWYDDMWMAKVGHLTINNNEKEVTFRAKVSCSKRDFYPVFPFKTTVVCDDRTLASVTFDDSYSSHDIEVTLGAGHKVSEIVVTSETSFIPAQIGAGEDTRELSVCFRNTSVEAISN